MSTPLITSNDFRVPGLLDAPCVFEELARWGNPPNCTDPLAPSIEHLEAALAITAFFLGDEVAQHTCRVGIFEEAGLHGRRWHGGSDRGDIGAGSEYLGVSGRLGHSDCPRTPHRSWTTFPSRSLHSPEGEFPHPGPLGRRHRSFLPSPTFTERHVISLPTPYRSGRNVSPVYRR